MISKFSAYILAGGKSERLGGQEKGLLLLNGKPIICYVIDELRKLTADISIVTSNSDYEVYNCKLVEDFYKEIGPAAGISTALQNACEELVFITSCDMPFIKATSILLLLEQSKVAEITLWSNKKFIEPMFAIYRKRCSEKWDTLLLAGMQKLTDYFDQFDTNFVDASEVLKVNPPLFYNINTPEDLLNATQWMKK